MILINKNTKKINFHCNGMEYRIQADVVKVNFKYDEGKIKPEVLFHEKNPDYVLIDDAYLSPIRDEKIAELEARYGDQENDIPQHEFDKIEADLSNIQQLPKYHNIKGWYPVEEYTGDVNSVSLIADVFNHVISVLGSNFEANQNNN